MCLKIIFIQNSNSFWVVTLSLIDKKQTLDGRIQELYYVYMRHIPLDKIYTLMKLHENIWYNSNIVLRMSRGFLFLNAGLGLASVKDSYCWQAVRLDISVFICWEELSKHPK